MTPADRYQRDLKRADFTSDPAQARAVEHTQRVFDELLAQDTRAVAPGGLFDRLLRRRAAASPLVRGLYFWGGVGRGKTYLVDSLYDCIPFERKLRIHFHRFMRQVHEELKSLKGRAEPLRTVAERVAERARILCFDEFHVADITDAMLLSGLLQALFQRGVTLVATSNDEPDRLYMNGLQRQRFLPAIDLIKTHCEVVNVDGGTDYRLRTLEQAEIYHSPLDAQAECNLRESFEHLAPDLGDPEDIPDPGPIDVNSVRIEGRCIPTVRCAEGVVWFEFQDICGGPRSAADYIEIARCFHTVLIANIPTMESRDDDMARRFVTLVDEFYDRNVKLMVSAAVPPGELYRGHRLAAMFQRTVSRLEEMRSHDYLAREHLP